MESFLSLPEEMIFCVLSFVTDRRSVAALRAVNHDIRDRLLPIADAVLLHDGTRRLDYGFGLPPSLGELSLISKEIRKKSASVLGVYTASWSRPGLTELMTIFRNEVGLKRLYIGLLGPSDTIFDAERTHIDILSRARGCEHCWPQNRRPDFRRVSVRLLREYFAKLNESQLALLKKVAREFGIFTWQVSSPVDAIENEQDSVLFGDRLRRAVLVKDGDRDRGETDWSQYASCFLRQDGSSRLTREVCKEVLPTFRQLARESFGLRAQLQIVRLLQARQLFKCAKAKMHLDEADVTRKLIDELKSFSVALRGQPSLSYTWKRHTQLPRPILRKFEDGSWRFDIVLKESSLIEALQEELVTSGLCISQLGVWGSIEDVAAITDCSRIYLACPGLKKLFIDQTAPDDLSSSQLTDIKARLICYKQDPLRLENQRRLGGAPQYFAQIADEKISQSSKDLAFVPLCFRTNGCVNDEILAELIMNYIMNPVPFQKTQAVFVTLRMGALNPQHAKSVSCMLPTYHDLVGTGAAEDFLRMVRLCEMRQLLDGYGSVFGRALFEELYAALTASA